MRARGRRRRAAVVLLLAAALATGSVVVGAAAQSDEHVAAADAGVVRGAVSARGNPVGVPAGWSVAHPSPGRYVLRFEDNVRLSLGSWDAAASVTARPTEAATWVIDFAVGAEPADTAFTFTAGPRTQF